MKTKLFLFCACALLAIALGASAAPALALPQPRGANATSVTIPYSGRLTNETGQPVADGAYDFAFALYDAEADGVLLWAETQPGVTVTGGNFVASLGNLNAISATALEGGKRWLAVGVRGPGERDYTALTPRQVWGVGSSAPQAAPAAGPSCPHNHFGETWSSSGWPGLVAETTSGNLMGALVGRTLGTGSGVYGDAVNSGAINMGVLGTGNSSSGYGGLFYNTGGGIALSGKNDSGGIAVYAEGNGGTSLNAALRVENTNTANGIAAYLNSNSSYPTLEIDKQNHGGAAIDLQLFNPGTNSDPLLNASFIRAYDENVNLLVNVAANGAIFAKGFGFTAADMAEMLPAEEGLMPGDVLVIGPDGQLIRSTQPYQTSVAGVYSTQPGIVAGQPIEGKVPGTIPLAMNGTVPVKVSAESGPIRPGDLLVASSTPGYAMKAGPNPPQGTVIGKAFEKLDAGTGVIKMLATLQ